MKTLIDIRKTVETAVDPRQCAFNFFWQITSAPHLLPPVEVARYNSLAPYSNGKGCINVDQLGKQRRPRVSQSVNGGRRWRGKYCFASRGEQSINQSIFI